jgi:hypothetical protein
VRDTVSAYLAMRLSVAKDALPGTGPIITSHGWAANAELIGRTAAVSRRIEGVPTRERYDLLQRPIESDPWMAAKALWRAADSVRIPRGGSGPGSGERPSMPAVV